MEQNEKFEMPVCECSHVHEELVDALKQQTPDDETLIRLAELFKIFGDPTRIKIL